MRHILLISGKDSLATALVQTEREPDLPYEYISNDVEAELPETYAWLDEVEGRTGWPIQRVGHSLQESIVARNGFLPSPRARYCTKECKIEPLEVYLGSDPATVYYGLRADEKRIGYVPVAGSTITPRYPLIEAGIDINGVYEILDRYDLAPPNFFWPRLHTECKRRLDMVLPSWEQRLTRFEFDTLFAGRSRGNCFTCFFQRLYEWVWLLEIHPDLFAQAKAFELPKPHSSVLVPANLFEAARVVEGRLDSFTWNSNNSLASIEVSERAEQIFQHRVRMVCGQVAKKWQMNFFDEPDSEIAQFSCGLLCGK